jgi:ADP-dependent phosphofructokinase/glucokinase
MLDGSLAAIRRGEEGLKIPASQPSPERRKPRGRQAFNKYKIRKNSAEYQTVFVPYVRNAISGRILLKNL